MRKTIFVSHSSIDKPVVEGWIVKTLANTPHLIWWDKMLIGGKPWREQLAEAIRKCDLILFAVTRESLESEWCLWELQEAFRQRKPIIPVKLRGNINPPEWLKRIQFVDFTAGPIDGSAVMGLSTAIYQAEEYMLEDLEEHFFIINPVGTPTNATSNDVSAKASSEKRGVTVSPEDDPELVAKSQTLFEQADILYWAGNYDEAIASLKDAIQLRAVFPEAHNRLGACYLAKSNLELAEQHFDLALSQQPDFGRALHNKGLIAFNRKQYEQSLKWFNQSLIHDPSNAEAHEHRGRVYWILHQPQNALNDFKAAMDLKPTDPEYHFYSSHVLSEVGNPLGALREAEIANNLQSGSKRYLERLTICLSECKHYKRSIEISTELIGHDPHNVIGYYYRSIGILKMGDIIKSRSDAMTALSLAESVDNRADCLCLLGDIDEYQQLIPEAKTSFQKALELNPQNEYARDALLRLTDP